MALDLRQRLAVLVILALGSLTIYAVAGHYSFLMVAYVVEQTLIQKAPPDVGPAEIRRRLAERLDTADPDRKAMILRDLSLFLEKVQRLTREDLNRLLKEEAPPAEKTS
jgi:hypothetical protein